MSICDSCIHDYVCGLEDNHEEGIVSCTDRIPKDVLDKIRAELDLETRVQVKHYTNTDDVIDTVLDIIDKYKSGSEDKTK